MTPPSTIASRNMHAKAGPHPDSAVDASKWRSSRRRQRPIEEKICRTICLFSPSEADGGRVEITVMPSRICIKEHLCELKHSGRGGGRRTRHATLGIVRTTVVLGWTQAVSCAMLTPGRMLMSNFPAKASLIPLALSMGFAPCGLQLCCFVFRRAAVVG